jgi:hypothetical protein
LKYSLDTSVAVAYAVGATDLFYPECRDFICQNSNLSFLVPEAIKEFDLVIDGIGADDPDYRGIRERIVTDIVEITIRAEEANTQGTSFRPAALRGIMPSMTSQHTIRAIESSAGSCNSWSELTGMLRTAAIDFETGLVIRKERLFSGVNRVLLTAEEEEHSSRKTEQIRALLPEGGRSWARDSRIAAETDTVAARKPELPGPALVTVETGGHFKTKKAQILRLTRISEIRPCGKD